MMRKILETIFAIVGLGLSVLVITPVLAANLPPGPGGTPPDGTLCIFGPRLAALGVTELGGTTCIDQNAKESSTTYTVASVNYAQTRAACSFLVNSVLTQGTAIDYPPCTEDGTLACFEITKSAYSCASSGFFIGTSSVVETSPPVATPVSTCQLMYTDASNGYSYTEEGTLAQGGYCIDSSSSEKYPCNASTPITNINFVDVSCPSYTDPPPPPITQTPIAGVTSPPGSPVSITPIANQSLTITKLGDFFPYLKNFLFLATGIVVLAMIVWSGFLYVTAGGNQKKIALARSILLYTFIGLAIIAFSVIIIRIVLAVFGITISGFF